ncbi:MAG: hypothetical protein ACE5LC_06700 [Candidatus Aminicenantales bacterium]
MFKKTLSVIGVALLLFILQSCGGKPEADILERYFHAVSLNDVTTMSTMAIEPVAMEYENWKIVKSGEERVEPAILPDLDKKEKEAKKALEDHVGPTVEAQDALYIAQDKLDTARTRAARRAAQREVDEAQKKFDEEREIHRQLQKTYNDAKAEAAQEEEIALFSLGVRELPNIRSMEGDVHFKDVEVQITQKAGVKNYIFRLRRYILSDKDLGITRRGQWKIVSIELIE